MKKFFKILMYVVLSILLIFIISTISTMRKATNLPEKELTQSEKDSISRYELDQEIKNINEQIETLKSYVWNANDLLAYYDKNEVKADNGFKNKTAYVKGKITDIGKDILERPYISIGLYDYVSTVQCVFDKKYIGQISELEKGQTVLLKGLCKGKLVNVIFEDCIFIDDIPVLQQKLKDLQLKK